MLLKGGEANNRKDVVVILLLWGGVVLITLAMIAACLFIVMAKVSEDRIRVVPGDGLPTVTVMPTPKTGAGACYMPE